MFHVLSALLKPPVQGNVAEIFKGIVICKAFESFAKSLKAALHESPVQRGFVKPLEAWTKKKKKKKKKKKLKKKEKEMPLMAFYLVKHFALNFDIHCIEGFSKLLLAYGWIGH